MEKAVRVLCVIVMLAALAGAGWYYYSYYKETQIPAELIAKPKPSGPPPEMAKSPIVSSETKALPTTDARATLQLRKIAPLLRELVPWEMLDGTPLADNTKNKLKDDFEGFIPNEISFLLGSDYDAGKVNLTCFVNQQYLEPLLPMALGQILDLSQVPFIDWGGKGLEFAQPGVVMASGTLPIPEGAKEKLAEHWTELGPLADTLKPSGEHLFEVVLDNRRGELLSLFLAAATQNGLSLDGIYSNPMTANVPKILGQLNDVNIYADVDAEGALVVGFAIHPTAAAGPEVSMMLNMAVNSFVLPQVEERLAELGFDLEGEAKAEGTDFKGAFKVPGFAKKLKDEVANLSGGGGKAKTAPTPAPEPAEPATANP